MSDRDNHHERMTEFLTPEDVAEILRINVMTVYGYIQKDNLNAVRLGRNYRISRQDLESFLRSKRTKVQKTKQNIQLVKVKAKMPDTEL
jgi:excisionase family DNA binding protein